MPETPSTEKAEVSLRIGVSPDEFRELQEGFVHLLASLLNCEEKDIEILGVHPARPDINPDFINVAQLQKLGALGLTEY